MTLRTIEDTISSIVVKRRFSRHSVGRRASSRNVTKLPSPSHSFSSSSEKLVLGVSSMRDHMTDEGWQITHGLSLAGYRHCGYGLDVDCTDVNRLISDFNPSTVVIQDIREWDVKPGDFRDAHARFINYRELKRHDSIFKVTILKDSHQNPEYHKRSADSMGMHAWIVYYSPRIVHHLAQFTRPQHLIRTTHSIDPAVIPVLREERGKGCLFSGAVSNAYPMRQHLLSMRDRLQMDILNHPGYHRNGSSVPQFLSILNDYKVAICTSSMYGYALRKLIEATCCGCIAITDLPTDDVLPIVEENLIRVSPRISAEEMNRVISEAVEKYDFETQKKLAERAAVHYNYHAVTNRLAVDIEALRGRYS